MQCAQTGGGLVSGRWRSLQWMIGRATQSHNVIVW